MAEIWTAVRLTLTLALVVTVLLVIIGTPIAWWLARSKAPWKEAVAAVTALPLVLPPTVLGFYLLLAFGPYGPGGTLAGLWGARTLAFSFEGLVIGSLIYSLPFMVQPLRNAFEAFGEEPLEAAATLGATPWQSFLRIAVPLARAGYLSGAILTFAHTVGEFGVVLMIGGNIPDETRTVSIAIYDHVQAFEDRAAGLLSAVLVAFCFASIVLIQFLTHRIGKKEQ